MPSVGRRTIHLAHRKGVHLVAVAAAIAVVLAACGSNDLPDRAPVELTQNDATTGAGGCYPGREGCECSPAGATTDCGRVVQSYGSYVTCSEGTSTCTQGAWSACLGNTLVTKSLGGATLGGGGIRVLSQTVSCMDPCDPNSCTLTLDGPGDVPDGAPVLVTEAGVTIPPTLSAGDAGPCVGLGCQVDFTCPAGHATTLTGKVYDPAGKNPLFDAYVYIPVDPDPANIPAFSQGVSCDTCAGADHLNAVAAAQTDAAGSFTLTNVPTTALGPNNPIPLVVQLGKWRRVILLPSVPDCASTPVPPASSRLPRNQTDGYGNHADMPQVAFVSGALDPFECMLLKAGIDPNEFGSSTLNSNRRFHYYNSPDKPGDSIDPAFGNVVTGDKMWNSTAANPINGPWGLSAYDVVLLACEGAEYNVADRATAVAPATTSGYENLAAYANAGGRVFMTHFSYVWMRYNTPWKAIPASWNTGATIDAQDPLDTTVVTAFPKGLSFNSWLANVGALDTNGFLEIHQGRQDDNLPLAATVQPWLTAEDTSNAKGTCATATCYQASDCPTAVCSGVIGKCSDNNAACETSADCATGNTCNGAVIGTCTCGTAADCLGSGVCNGSNAIYSPAFTFNAPLDMPAANQCGRAVFTDFHVATSAQVSQTSPTTCTTSADCGAGATCAGAAGITGTCTAQQCSPAQSVTSQCGDSHFTCAGGTSGTCGCFQNSDCATLGAGTCTGGTLGQCVMNGTCTANNQCKSGSCNTTTKVCNAEPTCESGAGCGSKEKCTGETAGLCSAPTCYANTDCTVGNQVCSGAAAKGTCVPNACTTAAQCQNKEQCIGGTCSGCFQNSDCPGGSEVCAGGTSPGTCTGVQNHFPYECTQGALDPQEAALEFLFFDLSACVSPNSNPPPPPPAQILTYAPVTFTVDFPSACPSGTAVKWRELDWQATIPDTASIVFSAQTASPADDGGPPSYDGVQSVVIANAVMSSPATGLDEALIDETGGDAGALGAFNTAVPPVNSATDLRLTITLNPTTDFSQAPTLIDWQVKSDCPASE
jgi:hypothetical protein